MSTPTVGTRRGRELLSAVEFDGVVATVLDNNPGMPLQMAERITDQALAFVATAAVGAQGIAPSRAVDEGWHALILHTRLYGALGRSLGAFVHHTPERPGAAGYDPDWLTRTQGAIRRAGYRIDSCLWRGPDDDTIPVTAPAQHTPNGPNCYPIGPGGNPPKKPTGSPSSAATV